MGPTRAGGHADADGTITSPGYTAEEVSAPNGVYSITDNPNVKPGHEDWFGVIKQDDRIDDYFADGGNIRSGIRLHMGKTSWGCATVNEYSPGSDHHWQRIKDLIGNTSTTTLDFRNGPHWYNGTNQLTNYGTLTIK
ncbi:MAG: tlde1 domain-containing protein [Flavisolibacter sp.]